MVDLFTHPHAEREQGPHAMSTGSKKRKEALPLEGKAWGHECIVTICTLAVRKA